MQGIEWLVGELGDLIRNNMSEGPLKDLLVDGIIGGVGGVIVFLPNILLLYFFISLMEDSGYMARAAFIMDKIMHKMGLHGKSFIPLIMGFGCNVPAIMASRTIENRKSRLVTMLINPLMSCSARLPIYLLLAGAFFPNNASFVLLVIYAIGILLAVVMARLFCRFLVKGDDTPFVMELPNYRMPGLKSVALLLWEKAKDFLQKAFTVILIATMLIWFLQSFDIHFNMVTDSKDSMLAAISSIIVPVFKPLGLGDWRICTSLISGLMAKESVVSTLEILFGGTVTTALTTLSAASLLVFSLLYSPCVAAIASIKRELGAKWAVSVVLLQCAIAWVAAFIVRVIGLLVM